MQNIKPLLSDQLRPKSFDCMALNEKTINRLKYIVETGDMPNLLFHGAPGTGKTSSAELIINTLDCEFIEYNGSDRLGQKSLFQDIKKFCSGRSLWGKRKIVFIDECDYLLKATQAGLRRQIETASQHDVRFIMTANETNRLIPAMLSRLTAIDFDASVRDRPEIIERVTKSIADRLVELDYNVELQDIQKTVGIYYPDFRTIANKLEMLSMAV